MKYSKSNLTPAKKKFAKVYAQTDNGTKAIKEAYPELAANSSDNYLRVKSTRLLTNDNVKNEIDIQKAKIEQLANKAISKIDKTIDSEDERLSFDASKWVYEQVHGKSVQKTQATSVSYIEHVSNKRQVYDI